MLGGFFGAVANIGKNVSKAAGVMFSLDDDDGDGELIIGDGFSGANFEVQTVPTGHGYELGYMYYQNPDSHRSAYFFTTQLATPFPSYSSNPLPNFPPRVAAIPNVKPPVESIIAPRIRLGPRELSEKTAVLAKMRDTATAEDDQPECVTLNLAHQCLGDMYQYPAFVTFMDLNRCVRVLNLCDNELDDITDLQLPVCEKLYLSHNSFVSFLHVPELPNCRELYMSDNFLSGFAGLDGDRFPKLRVLVVALNPIEHVEEYRKAVHKCVPTIEVVDGERP
jgi:hypothetical protein